MAKPKARPGVRRKSPNQKPDLSTEPPKLSDQFLKRLFILAVLLGFVDPNCTLEKVCVPNYDKTVRPASSYTTALKKRQMKEQGLGGDISSYEEDHIIPLVLCGAPRDERNLTPEKWDRARKKDVMEVKLHKAVCLGEMRLGDAQKKIVGYE